MKKRTMTTKEQLVDVYFYHKEGKSAAEICRLTGISSTAVFPIVPTLERYMRTGKTPMYKTYKLAIKEIKRRLKTREYEVTEPTFAQVARTQVKDHYELYADAWKAFEEATKEFIQKEVETQNREVLEENRKLRDENKQMGDIIVDQKSSNWITELKKTWKQ